MVRCLECDEIFEEEEMESTETTYEQYYGVTDLPGRHSLTLHTCPFCGSDELEYDVMEDEVEDYTGW